MRITQVETVIGQFKSQLANLQETTIGLGDTLQQVSDQGAQLSVDIAKYASGLATEKTNFSTDINIEFDKHKKALAQVVNEA